MYIEFPPPNILARSADDLDIVFPRGKISQENFSKIPGNFRKLLEFFIMNF